MRIICLILMYASSAIANTNWQQLHNDIDNLAQEVVMRQKCFTDANLPSKLKLNDFYAWQTPKHDGFVSNHQEKYRQLIDAINNRHYRKAQMLAASINTKQLDSSLSANTLAILLDLAFLFQEYTSADKYLADLVHKHPGYLSKNKVFYLEWIIAYAEDDAEKFTKSAQQLLKKYPDSQEADKIRKYHQSMLTEINKGQKAE